MVRRAGVLTLGPGSRIVVDSANKTVLADEARMLSDDLADVTGSSLPVVSTPQPRAGDIFLSLQGADPALGPEGYELNVGDVAELRGTTEAGVFYGTQTLLQMLKTAPGHRVLPRGAARDWPQQRERGFLLDAGRKYYSPDFIVQAIREMSYLKLNTLQLHFSDNDAFRLVSERFPYLASPQAYTRADISRFEAAARRYHVTIIPEIEMPAHSTAVLLARPDLGFDCPQMGNATVDVTKPAVRQFETALIDEFAPLFSGPEFMIATDEYPTQATQQTCPELVQYAQAHGFASTADVFVDFINHMNRVVRSHGKQTRIWNWWNVDQNPTTAPDKNITVEVWTTAATGTTVDHSPQTYLDMGYNVVASPSDTLYVTPGSLLLPDPKFLYEQWAPLIDPHLDGYQISVWADNAPDGARQLLRRLPTPPARGARGPAVGRPAPGHGR